MKTKHLIKFFGLIMAVALTISCSALFTACNNEEEKNKPHTHTYATTWEHDETNHWHAATCEHTSEKSSNGAHTFGTDNKCTVCGYQKAEPPHTHTFAEAWEKNETEHWHAATCEHTSEVDGKEAHKFVGNTCTVCSYQKEVIITAKCELACPICGKCSDEYCTVDTDKCGNGLTSHIFEAEESVITKGAVEEWDDPNINNRIDVGEPCDYVQGLMGSLGTTLSFTIVSDKDAVVTLRVRSAKNVVQSIFTEGMTVLVNGEIFDSKAYVAEPGEGLHRKRDFDWKILGCINLEKGENTIEFVIATADSSKGYNMDKIELLAAADVNLTWTPTDNSDKVGSEYSGEYVSPSFRANAKSYAIVGKKED